jgi:protein SCO1
MMKALFRFALICALAGSARSETGTRWLSPGPSLPDAALVDSEGHSRNFATLAGQGPVVVGFFFTGCRTICPTQVVQLSAIQELSKDLNAAERPTLILVSLDPLGDTPQAVREFAARFDLKLGDAVKFVMLTGDVSELSKVWQAFEQPQGNAASHTAQFWIGFPDQKRWTRADSMAQPSTLLQLLSQAEP